MSCFWWEIWLWFLFLSQLNVVYVIVWLVCLLAGLLKGRR